FQALPFTEPATGLVFARERWYDPGTGSFLSPDPLGHRDSSNLYSFCVGDPVNNSDPTGLAASMGTKGWIVATDNRNGGRIRRFSPAEIAADPQGVRAFLGLNADVDPREADAMIERAGHAWATGGDKMRVVAPGAAKAAGVYPLMAATAGAGIGGGIGVVAAGELGLGFVGSAMLPGFTGGVGSQAGTDIHAWHFSGVRQYAVSGSAGAIGSLVVGGIFAGGQHLFGTPDVFPSIMPEGGWRFPEPSLTTLRRPYKRVAFCEAVECGAIRTSEGLPIDPNTGEVIAGEYHFGHRYGYEHRRLVREALSKGMKQKQFNDWINSHPEWFQLEAPANNLSHRFEKPGVD
ncbi:MAG: GH-E family nuclease, partial [Acidobacteriota bacterium]